MAINLGNVTGLLKSTTPPTKKYVLWGKILNPSFPDIVEINYWDEVVGAWTPVTDPTTNYWLRPVINRTTTLPPVTPVEGDRYLVAAGATGVWSGKDDQVATYRNSAWVFQIPLDGFIVSDRSEVNTLLDYRGAYGGGGAWFVNDFQVPVNPADFIPITQKDAPNGVAPLDENRKIPAFNINGETLPYSPGVPANWGVVPSTVKEALDYIIANPPSPGGSGDVTGPGSSADNAISVYNGATGKIIKSTVSYVDAGGNLILGDAAATVGTSRSISVAGTSPNIDLHLVVKGTSPVVLVSNGTKTLSLGVDQITSNTSLASFIITSMGVTGANNSNNIHIKTGHVVDGKAGDIRLTPGGPSGIGKRGNLQFFGDATEYSTWGNLENGAWWGPGTAPSTNPVAGGFMWVDATNDYRPKWQTPTGVVYEMTGAGGGSSLPFSDNTALIKNVTDATKLAIFSAASISAGTTRTYTLPNNNGTLVLASTTLAGYGITDAWAAGSGVAMTAPNTISGAHTLTFTNPIIHYATGLALTWRNPANTASYSIQAGAITTDRVLTLPTVTGPRTILAGSGFGSNRIPYSPAAGGEMNFSSNFTFTPGTNTLATLNVTASTSLVVGGTSLTTGSVADFQSTTLGLLVPRVTTIAGVVTPSDAMVVYDTATNLWNFRQNGVWLNLGIIGGSTGATDNRVLRADGTGGLTLQNSLASIDDTGNIITADGIYVGLSATQGVILSSGAIEFFAGSANNAIQVANTGEIFIKSTNIQKFELITASTSTVINGFVFTGTSTGTPLVGIGVGLQFSTETAANTYKTGGIIESVSTNITSSTEAFDLVFKLMVGGAAAVEKFRFSSFGGLKVPGTDYGTSGQALVSQGNSNAVTWASVGNVFGPASSTDSHIPRFDLATGKLLKTSRVLVNDDGDITMGIGAAGGGRGISAGGTLADVSIFLVSKGAGSANITTGSGKGLRISGAENIGTFIGGDFSIQATVANHSYNFTVTTADANPSGNYNSGNLYLKVGAQGGIGTRGNIGIHTSSVANWQAMELGMFIANKRTAPTGAATGGTFMYSDSDNLLAIQGNLKLGDTGISGDRNIVSYSSTANHNLVIGNTGALGSIVFAPAGNNPAVRYFGAGASTFTLYGLPTFAMSDPTGIPAKSILLLSTTLSSFLGVSGPAKFGTDNDSIAHTGEVTLSSGDALAGIFNSGNVVIKTGSSVGGVRGNVKMPGLPTSAAGLPANSLWNNGGVLSIV